VEKKIGQQEEGGGSQNWKKNLDERKKLLRYDLGESASEKNKKSSKQGVQNYEKSPEEMTWMRTVRR